MIHSDPAKQGYTNTTSLDCHLLLCTGFIHCLAVCTAFTSLCTSLHLFAIAIFFTIYYSSHHRLHWHFCKVRNICQLPTSNDPVEKYSLQRVEHLWHWAPYQRHPFHHGALKISSLKGSSSWCKCKRIFSFVVWLTLRKLTKFSKSFSHRGEV